MNTPGTIVRTCRKKSGLTQIELARLAGVGKTVIFDIEKGKDSVRWNTLLRVLTVLDIRLELHSPLGDAVVITPPNNELPEDYHETC